MKREHRTIVPRAFAIHVASNEKVHQTLLSHCRPTIYVARNTRSNAVSSVKRTLFRIDHTHNCERFLSVRSRVAINLPWHEPTSSPAGSTMPSNQLILTNEIQLSLLAAQLRQNHRKKYSRIRIRRHACATLQFMRFLMCSCLEDRNTSTRPQITRSTSTRIAKNALLVRPHVYLMLRPASAFLRDVSRPHDNSAERDATQF